MSASPDKLWCAMCDVRCVSAASFRLHLEGKKHVSNSDNPFSVLSFFFFPADHIFAAHRTKAAAAASESRQKSRECNSCHRYLPTANFTAHQLHFFSTPRCIECIKPSQSRTLSPRSRRICPTAQSGAGRGRSGVLCRFDHDGCTRDDCRFRHVYTQKEGAAREGGEREEGEVDEEEPVQPFRPDNAREETTLEEGEVDREEGGGTAIECNACQQVLDVAHFTTSQLYNKKEVRAKVGYRCKDCAAVALAAKRPSSTGVAMGRSVQERESADWTYEIASEADVRGRRFKIPTKLKRLAPCKYYDVFRGGGCNLADECPFVHARSRHALEEAYKAGDRIREEKAARCSQRRKQASLSSSSGYVCTDDGQNQVDEMRVEAMLCNLMQAKEDNAPDTSDAIYKDLYGMGVSVNDIQKIWWVRRHAGAGAGAQENPENPVSPPRSRGGTGHVSRSPLPRGAGGVNGGRGGAGPLTSIHNRASRSGVANVGGIACGGNIDIARTSPLKSIRKRARGSEQGQGQEHPRRSAEVIFGLTPREERKKLKRDDDDADDDGNANNGGSAASTDRHLTTRIDALTQALKDVEADKLQHAVKMDFKVQQLREKHAVDLKCVRHAHEEEVLELRKSNTKLHSWLDTAAADTGASLETTRAKVKSQNETLCRFKIKEASHIKMLQEKDAVIAKLKRRIAELSDENQERDVEIDACNVDIENAMRRMQALKTEKAEVVGKHQTLEQEHLKLGVNMRKAEQKLAIRTSQMQDVTDQMTQCQAHVEALMTQVRIMGAEPCGVTP